MLLIGKMAIPIKKEMHHVLPAFTEANCTLQEIQAHIKLVGFQRIRCHLVFDVKMDFTRKVRFVANGAKTVYTSNTYAGVVSKETVRIALTYAALNNLDLFAADIENAYLKAQLTEKYYTRYGS